MIVFFPILLVLLVTTIIVFFNFITAPVLKFNSQEKVDQDLVSVLIPARNESNNIENCLNKIINQSEYHFSAFTAHLSILSASL